MLRKGTQVELLRPATAGARSKWGRPMSKAGLISVICTRAVGLIAQQTKQSGLQGGSLSRALDGPLPGEGPAVDALLLDWRGER